MFILFITWKVTDILYYCFLRLDYSGIAIFIMGSFIPPLYYGFYCSRVLKVVYICLICSLGIICIIVSLWDKFNAPEYRLLRAGKVFIYFFRAFVGSVFLDVVLRYFCNVSSLESRMSRQGCNSLR